MLAIGRALMGNPRVLLMDEPSEGLAPQLVAEVGRTIAQLKAEGQSIVLVEQNIKLTLNLADDVVIINTGRGGVHAARPTRSSSTTPSSRSISACSDANRRRSSSAECQRIQMFAGQQVVGARSRDDGGELQQSDNDDALEQVRARPRRASTASRGARSGRRAPPSTSIRTSRFRRPAPSSSRTSTWRRSRCAHFANAETRALSQKQEEDIRARITGYRRAPRRSRRHGHRHAARHAAAEPVLLHGAARRLGRRPRAWSTTGSPNTSRASPTASWRSAPCR